MNAKKKVDWDMPIGKMTRIPDFLPKPEKLAAPRDDIKVTLALSRNSVVFFKEKARQHHTKYQRMIRALVDKYAAHYFIGH